MVRTAIHAGVWSTDPAPDAVARVLESVSATGFDCLALPLRDLPRMQPRALAARFREAGIGALGTAGLPPGCDVSSDDSDQRQRGEEHLLRVIAVGAEIGVEQISGVLYGALGHAARLPDPDAMLRSAEVLHRVTAVAATAGVKLCVELVNRYETALLNTVEQALGYLRLVDHPNLRLHLDTYHMAIEERCPEASLRRALPVLGYFELDQSHRGRLDNGSLDLRAMSAPIRTSYDGLVGVEAFARARLAPSHADVLAIWCDHFDDGTALAHHAQALIREIFDHP
ncbi:sugar phosphate isomerase/epimerase [Tropicimonas sp. IMCC34043]|uniref:sugar phosphate isomerase/epimerase family protein n=1 Tax=Tropicimonas sp. IMCC34043 TaxID=2248760 RepID=UPI000E289A2B|nr:sugar phosphate isomerase/epimerase family protein [Tropicimonas sp. IMCC34043]